MQEFGGNYQNVLDWNGQNSILLGGKEELFEGGHRLPMIWKWPKQIKSGFDKDSVVSYIDIYATLSEILKYKRNCNEAPDSKSLLPILRKHIPLSLKYP